MKFNETNNNGNWNNSTASTKKKGHWDATYSSACSIIAI